MKKKFSFQFNKEKIIYIYIYIISQSLEKIQLDFKYWIFNFVPRVPFYFLFFIFVSSELLILKIKESESN